MPNLNGAPPAADAAATLSLKGQYLALLTSCSSMFRLRQIHARLFTSGLYRDHLLASELLRFCSLSPSGSLSHALAFLRHAAPDNLNVASWNHVIRGCATRGSPREALEVFSDIRHKGARPSKLTFPFVLKACAAMGDLEFGRKVHAEVAKSGNDSDVYIQNSLISFYGSCKKFWEARTVFDRMSARTVVSWNAVLTACLENEWMDDAVRLFGRMRCCGFDPDETTVVVLLSASAELGNLSLGRSAHSYMVANGLGLNVQLGTALVNMYAKCGFLHHAINVFTKMEERNVWSWSAMILGYAHHGLAREALELFSRMKESAIHPNYVTFLGVLCACSHAGLVDEGYWFFNEMTYVYGIQPRMSHYSAMVDVIGRNGRLEEAYQFIQNIPVEPDPIVFRTLLSACNLHKNEDHSGVGERVRLKLLDLEPRRCGNYVMVANMYAEVGSWHEAAKVRKLIRDEGLKKTAGESCVEVGGLVHKFLSGDDSRTNKEDVYLLLEELNLNLRTVDSIDAELVENSHIGLLS